MHSMRWFNHIEFFLENLGYSRGYSVTIPLSSAVAVGARNKTDFSCWKRVIHSDLCTTAGMWLLDLARHIAVLQAQYVERTDGSFHYATLFFVQNNRIVVREQGGLKNDSKSHTYGMQNHMTQSATTRLSQIGDFIIRGVDVQWDCETYGRERQRCLPQHADQVFEIDRRVAQKTQTKWFPWGRSCGTRGCTRQEYRYLLKEDSKPDRVMYLCRHCRDRMCEYISSSSTLTRETDRFIPPKTQGAGFSK